jgi:hypothetical protein
MKSLLEILVGIKKLHQKQRIKGNEGEKHIRISKQK